MMSPVTLLGIFHFLVRFAVNVFFILSQTYFLKKVGVEALPYAYAVMNVAYVSLQFFSIRKLKGRTSDHLLGLLSIFLILAGVRLFLTPATSLEAIALFLILVMVFELLFNQFFSQFLSDIFPLQESKQNLPYITSFGSLSFIAGGFALKAGLSVLAIRTVLLGALGVFALCVGLFAFLRTQFPESRDLTPMEEIRVDQPENRVSGSSIPRLGVLLAASGFLGMVGKYWLDFQYSRVITTSFSSEADLASFIAAFCAVTDLFVLCGQMFLAGRVFQALPVSVVQAVLPLLMTVFCLIDMLFPLWWLILVTQFLFTLTAKSISNQTPTLMMGVLAPARRLPTMSRIGMAASAGSLFSSITLILFQAKLDHGAAFLALSVVFLGMTILTRPIGKAYSEELSRTLENVSPAGPLPLVEVLAETHPTERLAGIRRLLQGTEEQRLAALGRLDLLGEAEARTVVLEVFKGGNSPRVLATAIKPLTTLYGIGSSPLPGDLPPEILDDERILANFFESLPLLPRPERFAPLVRSHLDHPHHRLRSTAAATLVLVTSDAAEVEEGLRQVLTMLHDPAPLLRAAGTAALGMLQHEATLPQLCAMLEDPDHSVVRQAILALGRIPISASLESLRDFLERTPHKDLAVLASGEVSRMETLNQKGVFRVLESLSAGERGAIAGDRKILSQGERRRLLFSVLRIPEEGARKALTEFVRDCRNDEFLEAFSRIMTSGENGFRFDPSRLPDLFRAVPRSAGFELASIASLFLAHGNHALHDRLLEALLERTWFEHALSRKLPVKEPQSEASIPEKVSVKLEEGRAVLFTLAANRCPNPRKALRIIGNAIDRDRFVSSLTSEFLTECLGANLSGRFIRFLDALSHPEKFLVDLESFTGIPPDSLSTETAMALLS